MPNCLACQQELIWIEYKGPMILSDARPLALTSDFYSCSNCGHAQKIYTRQLTDVVEAAYRSYEMYPQGDGVEQLVSVADAGGVAVRRSDAVVSAALSFWSRQQKKTTTTVSVLDIGCGSGNLLRSIERRLRDEYVIDLVGIDLNKGFKEEIEQLRSATFYTSIADVKGRQFDFVFVIHTLEHVKNPVEFLKSVKPVLKKDGILFIQVPNSKNSVYDLVIADHISHFTERSLTEVVFKAGFFGELSSGVDREITCVCTHQSIASSEGDIPDFDNCHGWLTDNIKKIKKAQLFAERLKDFAVFGSSISASWLISCNPDGVKVLLDEDTARWGNFHRGKPIISPKQFTGLMPLFFPLPQKTVAAILNRNKNLSQVEVVIL